MRFEPYKPKKEDAENADSSRQLTAAQDVEDKPYGESCSICMSDFEPGENLLLTPCKHLFHEQCIMQWIKNSIDK